MELNQPAINFELPDLDGRLHRLQDRRGKIVIVNFWSAECPHSERTDRSLIDLLQVWRGEVDLLSIASNRNESVAMIQEVARARRLPTVLVDAQQTVADLYAAVATPHAFILDREGILRYRGAVDNATFRQRQATRSYVHEAVEALLQGHCPETSETPTYGCTIVREI